MSIYGDIILDHYQHPKNNKKLPSPTSTIHVDNPLCGDKLDMEVQIDKGIIQDIGFQGECCAISTASASLLTEYAKGKSKKELQHLSKDKVLELLGIELSPNRIKCGLLAWEALVKVIMKEEIRDKK